MVILERTLVQFALPYSTSAHTYSTCVNQSIMHSGVLGFAVCVRTTRLRELPSVDFIFHHIRPVQKAAVKVEI